MNNEEKIIMLLERIAVAIEKISQNKPTDNNFNTNREDSGLEQSEYNKKTNNEFYVSKIRSF